jgi:uncharacterized membrane protein
MTYQHLIRGTFISTIAGFLILIVLIILQLKGLNALKEPFTLGLLYVLFIMAIFAYLEYAKLPLPFYRLYKYAIPVGLVIVFLGLLFLTFGYFEGAYLIMLGYLSEPIGGVAPFKFYMNFNKSLGFSTYVLGAIYVLTLPLLIYNLALIPLIADFLKFIGFIGIYRIVLSNRASIEEVKVKANIS